MLHLMCVHLPDHPAWPVIAPCIDIQHRGSRRERTEIRLGLSIELQQQLLAVTMVCVACRKHVIHPIKQRQVWNTLYLKVTCDAGANKRCGRSAAARDEVDAIIAAVRARPRSV